MPQLDPTWFASQLFWLFASFVLFYLLMSRFILPPLLGVMDGRRNSVESDLEQAREMKAKAEHARDDYQRTLADARTRAQQLIDEATDEQKQTAEKAMRGMDAVIASKLEEAEKRIAARREDLVRQMTPTSGELAAMIVEKLTRKPASKQRIDSMLGEFAKSQRNG